MEYVDPVLTEGHELIRLPDTGEDVPPGGRERLHGGPPDPTRGPGHEDGSAGRTGALHGSSRYPMAGSAC